jgi:unsaturated rhamnogalacturonyl hydrolase
VEKLRTAAVPSRAPGVPSKFPCHAAGFALAGLLAFAAATAQAEPASPDAIRAVLKRAADWQLTHPSASSNRYTEDAWTWGAFYTGLMAWSRVSEEPKYRDAMLMMGQRFEWKPARRIYHADDHCVTQTYLELFLQDRDPAKLGPTQERFDYILAHPSTNDLHFDRPGAKDRWSWCDALFMSPPALSRLHTATGDRRYLEFMTREWWITTDFLYDREEHLYFRDSTYFDKREANGKKIFWSRGNGWVIAGLARVLEHLPKDHPDHPRFENLFREMAEKLLTCQQPDGLWRASLLDPESYPLKETSGSGFFTYAFAWGINHGLLDREKFQPATLRAWNALAACVDSSGKLTHVQPVGADPRSFDGNSSDVFGVGAFLLAGTEMLRMVEWRPLFNGTNLDGWSVHLRGPADNEGPARLVQVRNGMLHFYADAAAGSSQPFGYIATVGEYSNYRLRLEFKWGEKKFAPRTKSRRDSGLLYHLSPRDKVWPDSVECQIQENDVGDIYAISTRLTAPVDPLSTNILVTISTNRTTGGIRTNRNAVPVFLETGPGSVPYVQGAVGTSLRVVRQALHEHEGWNTVEIEVHGDKATHRVNGQIVNGCRAIQQRVDGAWAPLDHGRIALQLEGAEILYRNVEIQELNPPQKSKGAVL